MKCLYRCQNKEILSEHIESEHNLQIVYACDSCDYVSRNREELKKHVKKNHKDTSNEPKKHSPCNPPDPKHSSE